MPRSLWNTPREAADKLDMSTRQVAKLGDAGELEMMRNPGGQRRYAKASVDELARQLGVDEDQP